MLTDLHTTKLFINVRRLYISSGSRTEKQKAFDVACNLDCDFSVSKFMRHFSEQNKLGVSAWSEAAQGVRTCKKRFLARDGLCVAVYIVGNAQSRAKDGLVQKRLSSAMSELSFSKWVPADSSTQSPPRRLPNKLAVVRRFHSRARLANLSSGG